MHGRLLWLNDREPRTDAVVNPSMAQFHLWLARAQRDRNPLFCPAMAIKKNDVSSGNELI